MAGRGRSVYSRFKCEICGRKLKREPLQENGQGHWVYSKITGNRYCYPGEGCFK